MISKILTASFLGLTNAYFKVAQSVDVFVEKLQGRDKMDILIKYLQKDQYLLLAFGDVKTEVVDMLYFGVTAQSTIDTKDMQGKLGGEIKDDAPNLQNYERDVGGTAMSGENAFISVKRSLDTGDTTSPDKKLECGKDYTFSYLFSRKSADTKTPPNVYGTWKMKVNSDCSIDQSNTVAGTEEELKSSSDSTGASNIFVSAASMVAMMSILY